MLRYVVLAGLYLAQGLPFGFFSHAVPVLLNRTHPPEIVALSSILAMPWGFKFLFGPTVDAIARRKSVILPLNLLSVASLVILGFMRPSPDRLGPLVAGFFIVSLFSALQDVATDALALDLLAVQERGRGGSVQVAAQRAGTMLGGGGVLAIIDRLGYREAFWLMAAGIAVFTLPVLFQPEQPIIRSKRPAGLDLPARTRRFFKALGRPHLTRLIGVLVAFKLGDALAAGMVTRWYVKQGLSNTDVALSRGIVGGLGAIAGAVVGGWLYRRLSAARALGILAAGQTAAIAMYAVLDMLHPAGADTTPMAMRVYWTASALEHFLGGAATAGIFAWMMDTSRDASRATDYTVQACVLVGVTGLGILVSGFVTKGVGLLGLFTIATVVGLLAPIVAIRWGAPSMMAAPAR